MTPTRLPHESPLADPLIARLFLAHRSRVPRAIEDRLLPSRIVRPTPSLTVVETVAVVPRARYSIRDVIHAAERYFNLKPGDVLRKGKSSNFRRMGRLPHPGGARTVRRIVYYIAYDPPHITMPKIAMFFGHKDHTSVLYGIHMVRVLLAEPENSRLRFDVAKIREMVGR